ncbi:hypothetical protein KKD61_05270 [Patescibacteria group bacterium]|nr:hypothetical protein [Patescibacteria group bacterium]
MAEREKPVDPKTKPAWLTRLRTRFDETLANLGEKLRKFFLPPPPRARSKSTS